MAQSRSDIRPSGGLWQAYRQRLKRRALLWRAFRARHQLRLHEDNRAAIRRGDILLACCLRNEALRLPHFLDYYRALGVDHFLIVDNDSDDGSADLLRGQPDITIWHTPASYRASRFGMDWINWILRRNGAGHWCLTVDVDELFVFHERDGAGLRPLTAALDAARRPALGALMLDLYPEGAASAGRYAPGDDPLALLRYFDGGPFRQTRQPGLDNLWVQGGARDRVFFAQDPQRAPTLNKLPLVKWGRRFAYVNSTHSIRPRRINWAYDGPAGEGPAAALLHTKFLPDISARAAIEAQRGEHFCRPEEFGAYYEALSGEARLWHSASLLYKGWKQLADLGLIRPID